MSRDQFQHGSRWAFGIAAVLLALYTIREQFPELPRVFWPAFRVGSLLLAALGLLNLILYFLTPVTIWTVAKATSVVTIHKTPFRFSVAGTTDLPQVRWLYLREFPDQVPELPLMEAWLQRSDTAFWLVHNVKDQQDPRLVGSFKLLPLTRSGCTAMLASKASGSTFLPQHIARTRRSTAAYYVGDVVGDGQAARAAIVSYIQGLLQAWRASPLPIYARPLTPRGLATMKDIGFASVPSGGPPTLGQLCILKPSHGGSSVP